MKTSMNKVMLLGVLAMMLSSASIASANEYGDAGTFDKGEYSEQMQESKAAIEAAIMNNDFDTYKTLTQEKYADKADMRQGDDSEGMEGKEGREGAEDRVEMTEEEKEAKILEQFTEARTYYVENGELPTHDKKGGDKGGDDAHSDDASDDDSKKGMKKKRGSGKYFTSDHESMVAKIVSTADADKLERALTKIDAKIDSIEDEVVLDMLEGIREVIQEVLNGLA